jgi:hypothetical protein
MTLPAKKKLRFFDVYGIPTMLFSTLIPVTVLLVLGITGLIYQKELVAETGMSSQGMLVALVLFIAFGILFLVSSLVILIRRYLQITGSNAYLAEAEIVGASGSQILIRFQDNLGQICTGQACGFFFLNSGSLLFLRGERIWIYGSDKKIAVLLNGRGRKALVGNQSAPTTDAKIPSPSSVHGMVEGSLVSVSVYLILVAIGIVCFLPLFSQSSSNWTVALVLGSFLILFGILVAGLQVGAIFRALREHLRVGGKTIEVKIVIGEDRRVDAVYTDAQGREVLKPLIGHYTSHFFKTVDTETKVNAFLTAEGEVFFLKQ